MKKIKFTLFAALLISILTSCGTVREGFTNQKKNNSDEFLVEKKSPLIVPPNFDDLPVPTNQNVSEQELTEKSNQAVLDFMKMCKI